MRGTEQAGGSGGSGDELVDALRPLVAELTRAHDLALGDAHDLLVRCYRELTASLLMLTRRAGMGAGATSDGIAPELIDDTDRLILDALDRGILVTQIAREVHLSTRTVNRHLKRLRQVTGAQTPFQLGRAASSLGWLSSDEEAAVSG
jgi:DNA-binding NarL/FixJ family response regulator